MSMSRCSAAGPQRGMSGGRNSTRRQTYLGPALRGLDLSGYDLSRADLRGADLRGTKVCDADLSGAHLEGANFFKAVLDGANLAGAHLDGAQFLNCVQLIVTRNWQSAYRDETLACGEAVPDRVPSE